MNNKKKKHSLKRYPKKLNPLLLHPIRNCFNNNNDLMNSLQTNNKVKEIMKRVDRKFFCLHEENCYCDQPSKIIMNQTISAPHMHAKAIEYLQEKLTPGSKVLDVGSGSGYLTACFGEMVSVYNKDHKKRGKVIGIDIYKELVKYSNERIKKNLPKMYSYKNGFKIIHGSGWDYNPKDIKYDAIHVGASADSIPMNLVNLLNIGGIIVLPLKIDLKDFHTFCKITKDKDNNIRIELKESVRYVPLIKNKK